MSNQEKNQPDHDEIVSLLPWFVNQTLEEHQRGAVLSHIENCADCQREIQFLETLNEAAQNDAQNNYSMHADVNKDLTNVMNRIDAKSHPIDTVASGASLLQQKLGKFINFATALTIPQWSASALAGLLVAVLGFQLFDGQPENNYSVLSSSDNKGSSMRLSVEIATAVNQEQILSRIQSEVDKVGQQVNIETKKDGTYIIVFKDSVGVTEVSKLIIDLESETQIKRVEILP